MTTLKAALDTWRSVLGPGLRLADEVEGRSLWPVTAEADLRYVLNRLGSRRKLPDHHLVLADTTSAVAWHVANLSRGATAVRDRVHG